MSEPLARESSFSCLRSSVLFFCPFGGLRQSYRLKPIGLSFSNFIFYIMIILLSLPLSFSFLPPSPTSNSLALPHLGVEWTDQSTTSKTVLPLFSELLSLSATSTSKRQVQRGVPCAVEERRGKNTKVGSACTVSLPSLTSSSAILHTITMVFFALGL